MFYACGADIVVEKEVPVDGPKKPPVEKPRSGNPIQYTQMQGLLNKNCVKCHAAADFMQSEVLLRRSRVLGELTTRNMPPEAGALSDGERNLMVNFFR
jgi:hypothetical protein